MRTEKGSRAHLAWQIADSAGTDNLLVSLQRRWCNPVRHSPLHVVRSRRCQSQEERSERLMFSCSNLNGSICFRSDGIQALNSKLIDATAKVARASSLWGQPGILPAHL